MTDGPRNGWLVGCQERKAGEELLQVNHLAGDEFGDGEPDDVVVSLDVGRPDPVSVALNQSRWSHSVPATLSPA